MAPSSSPPILRSGPPMLPSSTQPATRPPTWTKLPPPATKRILTVTLTDAGAEQGHATSSPAPPTSARTQQLARLSPSPRPAATSLLSRARLGTPSTGWTSGSQGDLACDRAPGSRGDTNSSLPRRRDSYGGRSAIASAKTWETDGATTTCTCTPQPALHCRCYRLRHDPHCDNHGPARCGCRYHLVVHQQPR